MFRVVSCGLNVVGIVENLMEMVEIVDVMEIPMEKFVVVMVGMVVSCYSRIYLFTVTFFYHCALMVVSVVMTNSDRCYRNGYDCWLTHSTTTWPLSLITVNKVLIWLLWQQLPFHRYKNPQSNPPLTSYGIIRNTFQYNMTNVLAL